VAVRSTVAVVVVRLLQTGGRRGFVGSITQAAAGSQALGLVNGVRTGPVDLLSKTGDGDTGAGRTAGAAARDSRRLARRCRRAAVLCPGEQNRRRSAAGSSTSRHPGNAQRVGWSVTSSLSGIPPPGEMAPEVHTRGCGQRFSPICRLWRSPPDHVRRVGFTRTIRRRNRSERRGARGAEEVLPASGRAAP
jgi:hypothetical protein